MSVTGVISAADPYFLQTNSSFKARKSDFSTMAQAIKTGDLSTAQTALASFLNNVKDPQSSNSIFSSNTQVGKDLQSLQSALQSGDTKGAQSALQTLQADLSKVAGGKHHHHHSHESQATNTTAATGTNSSSPTDILTQLSTGSIVNAVA
jgi:hypothetical protein